MQFSDVDGVRKVVLAGRLDTAGVDRVETRFGAAIVPAGKNTVVDLTQVTFLASMGIRMLIATTRALSRKGGKLCVVWRRAGRHGRDRNCRSDRHYSVGGHGNRSDGHCRGVGRLNIREEEAGGLRSAEIVDGKLRLILNNTIVAVEEGQRELFRFLSNRALTPLIHHRLEVLFEELVANTIRHGFAKGSRQSIHVLVEQKPGTIELTFEDDGIPFNPLEEPSPEMFSTLETARIGGLGVLAGRQNCPPTCAMNGWSLRPAMAILRRSCLVIGPWSASLSDPPDRILSARARRCWTPHRGRPMISLPVPPGSWRQPVV